MKAILLALFTGSLFWLDGHFVIHRVEEHRISANVVEPGIKLHVFLTNVNGLIAVFGDGTLTKVEAWNIARLELLTEIKIAKKKEILT